MCFFDSYLMARNSNNEYYDVAGIPCPESWSHVVWNSYSLWDLSKLNTSSIDMSLDWSMLEVLILYTSCTMRSRMVSANGLLLPPSFSYQTSWRNWEQNIVLLLSAFVYQFKEIITFAFSVKEHVISPPKAYLFP